MLVVFDDIQNKFCVFSYILTLDIYALCSQPTSFLTTFCNCIGIDYRLTISQRVWMIETKNVYDTSSFFLLSISRICQNSLHCNRGHLRSTTSKGLRHVVYYFPLNKHVIPSLWILRDICINQWNICMHVYKRSCSI